VARDRSATRAFVCGPCRTPSSLRRADLVRRFISTTNHVRSYHTQTELLTVADRILRLTGRPDLAVAEAGCGKGASTAKLSLATKLAGGRLLVFDSFRGIPPNDERHWHLDGRPVNFRAGAFAGTLPSVQRTVARFGAIEVCEFHKGWFADTLPAVTRPLDVVLLDVDLVASTRTCVRYLYPRLRPGGVLFSQDGHLEATVALLADVRFWWDEVRVRPPDIPGLGTRKLLEIRAPA
jgi:O-methyltransferase